jgi:PAS domain S-box-containing protein
VEDRPRPAAGLYAQGAAQPEGASARGSPAGSIAPPGRQPAGAAAEPTSLAEHEERWRALLSSMLDPMVAIDAWGTIQAASDSVERVFGWRPDELIGQNVRVLMVEPHRSAHDAYLETYRRTGRTGIIGVTREFPVLRKDGERLTVELSVGRARPEGGRELFTGTFRDVTERRCAEESLRASEQRFHAIFDEAYQYLGLLSPDGTLLEANRTVLDATGTAREAVIGKPFWEARWWSYSSEIRERVREAVACAARGEFVRFEVEVRGRGNEVLTVDFSLKPVSDPQGRVVLLIPEGRDISEIKRVQRAETAMLRALATIGESAALLAHEIKNPITAVNVALRAVADQLGEDHRAVLEDLVVRMQRVEQMMRRTLTFARPLDLRRERIDALALLTDTVAHLADELASSGSTADVAADPGIEFVADRGLLEEVLANLVRNAIEAKGDSARVALSAVIAGGQVEISVADDGPGVPEAARATLFKPFTTTKRKGNGLGLAICRKIVEEHAGTIALDPNHTAGARFAIRLPRGPR